MEELRGHAAETIALTKNYGKHPALQNLDFSVEKGEIMVLLGPNGSGKTSLLLILATVLKPSSGVARVMAYDVQEDATRVRRLLGIAFQEARGFYRHKPTAILDFHGAVCGLAKPRRSFLIEQLLKDMDLWGSRNKPFMQLSGGQAKRLEVCKVFLQRPQFAVLDEPTSQVDLAGKRVIWEKIRELRERGSTVLVATNDVREAEYLADRLTVLHRGRRVVSDTVRRLKDSIAGGDVVELELEEAPSLEFQRELSRVEGTVSLIGEGDTKFRIHVSMAEAWVPRMTELCYQMGVRLLSVRVTEPSLDDVFMHYAGKAMEASPVV
jgi:ABC-2 type transport system ATP-binding protein